MELKKITDLTKQLGLSSRTLRYYEQIGLISSVRPEFETYRYYNQEAVARLQQIIILRKMQIPVKEIIRIYENSEMSTIVEVFTEKINEIDNEIIALSDLKNIINAFLKKMTESGIKKISALPLLYEEMEKQFELMEEQNTVSYSQLDSIGKRLTKPVEPSIISLPAMRVISSFLRENLQISDTAGFWRYAQSKGISQNGAGRHEQFEFQTSSGEAVMLRVPDNFVNNSEYADFVFERGLYASVNSYVDEDLSECFNLLVKCFDENKFYEIDYTHNGEFCRPALIENLISPDDKRELVAILVPVKKRVADPALFEKSKEISPDLISISEIEEQNPILWGVDVPLDKITPVNNPHYRVFDNGEAEYSGRISTRVLDTNVSVKLPFRVDIEFRLVGDDERFGFGMDEGGLIFYHGENTGYFASKGTGQWGFGVNMGNMRSDKSGEKFMRKEAISFRQPIFEDLYEFPKRGKINYDGYNHVTWIVGGKHLAVIINGEIRYCGVNFPYMSIDLSSEKPKNIMIGSNGQGMKYFRKIRISQLEYVKKTRLRNDKLIMTDKQSNNIIPTIHRLVTDEYGENYWFNGCARYVMECLGEPDYDYSFFVGLTGDVFAQYYPHGEYRGEGVSGYMLTEGASAYLRETDDGFELCNDESGFAERLFEQCGYRSEFVTMNALHKNTETYLQMLMECINKGVPVITWSNPNGVFVGYEEYGKTLLYITGYNNKPERISLESAISADDKSGWIFVGEKIKSRPLAEIYRERVISLPKLLTTDTEKFCFGAAAFRAWADDIENGKFDSVRPEDFNLWTSYTCYVCGIATNGTCAHAYLKKALELNPDMTFLEEAIHLYKRYGEMWNNDNGDDLEAIGGGFNITLETLKDTTRRSRIAAKLREFADVTDEIVRILKQGTENIC